jgi:hypothetical protein
MEQNAVVKPHDAIRTHISAHLAAAEDLGTFEHNPRVGVGRRGTRTAFQPYTLLQRVFSMSTCGKNVPLFGWGSDV